MRTQVKEVQTGNYFTINKKKSDRDTRHTHWLNLSLVSCVCGNLTPAIFFTLHVCFLQFSQKPKGYIQTENLTSSKLTTYMLVGHISESRFKFVHGARLSLHSQVLCNRYTCMRHLVHNVHQTCRYSYSSHFTSCELCVV